MKRNIFKTLAVVALAASMTSCGDDFLDTKNYKGVDVDNGLSNVAAVSNAVNGEYYWLHNYRFAGNYAINIGEIPTDMAYWNTATGHFDDIYQFTFTDQDNYLYGIWNYGYKVIDNSTRAIKAAKNLYESSSEDDKATLDVALGEAYALRGYAKLLMVNVYGHQVKVDGQDFSTQPGLVISDEPIAAFQEVERSTVGQTYESIISDFKAALEHFATAGGDQGQAVYFTKPAVEGLLGRTYLYMENFDEAYSYAQKALQDAGITSLATTAADYKALYNTTGSNSESLFYLAINSKDNFSANSCGTLWSTYGYLPSPKLRAMYGANDCRTSIFAYSDNNGVEYFKGGKFSDFQSGNAANATNYLVNASEMFLIEAEAKLRATTPDLAAAKEALLVVAKRNADIQGVDDLPTTKDDLFSFLKDERARELFQEEHRLWDLRRWNEKASVYAYGAPEVKYTYTNYNISDLVFPIPVDEINAGFGVKQNEWSNTLPKAN